MLEEHMHSNLLGLYLQWWILDSPHSVQTLWGCTIYETAQSPDDLSSHQLPVKNK